MTRATYLQDKAPGEANSAGLEVNIFEAGTRLISYGRNSFSPRCANIKRFQTIHSVSKTEGTHTVKFGGRPELRPDRELSPGQFFGDLHFQQFGGLRGEAAVFARARVCGEGDGRGDDEAEREQIRLLQAG